jgi:hypothetical protein
MIYVMEAAPELVYKGQTLLTVVEMLFEGRWWERLMEKSGITKLHGKLNQAHNELVALRGMGVMFDYRPYWSEEKTYWRLSDPMNTSGAKKLRPTLINRIKHRLNLKGYEKVIWLNLC